MKNIKIWAILLTIALVCGGCIGQPDASQDKTTEKAVAAQAEQNTEDKTTAEEPAKETGTEREPNPSVDPLQEYWEKTADVLSEAEIHEYYVGIYNEFAQNVRIGRINTNDGREQMLLLVGEFISLKEARQWIEDYKGFFVTGAAPSHLGEELMPGFETLQRQYNSLSAEDRKRADELLTMDWDDGSFSIDDENVAEFASLIGVGEGVMGQFFGVLQSYSTMQLPDGSYVE